MNNIFKNIPASLPNELFEEIVAAHGMKIERIISYGHTTPQNEWYDQNRDEWVMVLRGEAILSFFDGDDVKMRAGDYITIHAHQKHRVSWTKPDEETLWLALHY